MPNKKFFSIIALLVMFLFNSLSAGAEMVRTVEGDDIKLPEPVKTGGMPLMDALQNRKSDRKFSKAELPLDVLSNLLWAANGINRADGKRTVPTARNLQEITVFVILKSGVYVYMAADNTLKLVSKEDLRPVVGGGAPVTLLYVADLSRQSKFYATADCGFIGQNVYLFSAANGLATVFRGEINQFTISQKLQFSIGQDVLFGQSVGYPLGKKRTD